MMKIFIFGLGVIAFISMISRAFTSGPLNNTTIFMGGITAVLWAYAFFFDKLKKQKWLTYSIFTCIVVALIFTAAIFIYGGRVTTTFDEDVAIVLGAGLRENEVGPTLARRLDAAVNYHRQNPNALIVVSGGLGHRQSYTEAEVMARYLIARGVPADVIILEGIAYSTYSNMRYSMAILAELFDHTPSVAVITSDFHMYRSVQFARQVGFIDITAYSSSTPLLSVPFAYAREIAAIIKMWVFGT